MVKSYVSLAIKNRTIRAIMSADILPGAGPFYYEGNNIGVIIIHGGGGGTCADLNPLAKEIHQKSGYTVSVPLLPGFGTSPKILRKTSIEDFKKAIEAEIDSLKGKCEKMIIGGHSMGGILTLIMASKYDLNGIFTISAPIGVQRPDTILKMILKVLTHVPYFPVEYKKLKEETEGKWVGYKKIPINMGFKISKLLNQMKVSLKDVKCPALLMQGRLDSAIKPDSMEKIYNAINSEKKNKVWLENNDHPILDSPDHNVIVSEILNFIKNL